MQTNCRHQSFLICLFAVKMSNYKCNYTTLQRSTYGVKKGFGNSQLCVIREFHTNKGAEPSPLCIIEMKRYDVISITTTPEQILCRQ
uniref:Secreted protein n=1 Tax=Ascaris lumbricoides TaxID=6252 RepID=A0A0M3HRT3_ASCLU